MIFAKLDVCMATHPKFAQAGPAATGYWAAALAYIRGHDLGGVLPEASVGIPLGLGADAGRTLAEELVKAGLFARHHHGYELLRYAEKNETKEDVEARKDLDRVRKIAWRAQKKRSASTGVPRGRPEEVPGSDSLSGSESPEGVQGELRPALRTAAAIPPDFAPSAESRAYAEQLALKDIDAVVRKFRAVAAEKGWVTHDAEAKFRVFCEHELRFQRRERDRDDAHAKGGRRADEPVGPARRILR